MEKKVIALNAIGPSFEELDDDSMMEIDGEITPTVVVTAITKVVVTMITGVSVTFTIDRFKG